MASNEATHLHGSLQEADEAARRLCAATERVGITLPSLRSEWPACNGAAMVELGRVSAATALRLAQALNCLPAAREERSMGPEAEGEE
jgi:hypothetical protein